MATTSFGLINGGITVHYKFQYDDSLSAPKNPGGPEPARTNAVIAACENDFNLMTGWFGKISLDVNTPITVNIIPPGQPGACSTPGACWGLSSRNLTVTISDSNLAFINASFVRYLLVAEIVEQFMRAQGKGWYGSGTEGSEGEGLSRFLAAQFLAVNFLGNTPSGYLNSNTWLNSPRVDYVNNPNYADDGPDAVTGCALLFIYYLFSQLGFSINAIIAAGSAPLSGVYRNLTGRPRDPFPYFQQLLAGTPTITAGNLDDPFPLWAQQFGLAFPASVRDGSPLVVLSRTPQQEELFWIGANGDVSTTWRSDVLDSGQWHQQFGIAFPGSVRPGGPLIATAREPGQEDTFWFGANGDVSTTWRNDGIDEGRWHQQIGIAFPGSVRADSPLAVLNRDPHQQDIFWIGANGDVSTNWQNDGIDGGNWHQQIGIAFPGSVRADSPLLVMARGPHRMDIFWIGANGDVSTTWWDGGPFHQQIGIALPGSVRPGSPLVALARSSAIIEIFWLGANGDVSSTFLG
jgi:hypothetical protein